MYEIHKEADHLVVEFQGDFDYPLIRDIIHHETMLKEYPVMNDIWLIGSHHADIRLGELETMVQEFHCLCPTDATRTKTAIVVNEGLTGAVIELWIDALQERVAFDIEIFSRQDEARDWLGIAEEQVA